MYDNDEFNNESLDNSGVNDVNDELADDICDTDDTYIDDTENTDNVDEEIFISQETENNEDVYEEDSAIENEKNGNSKIVGVLIDKYSNLDKKKRKKIVLGLLLALILFFLIITDIIPILPNSFHRSYVGKSYELSDTQKSTYAPYDDYILYASDGRVICFEPNMKTKQSIDTFSGKPNLRVNTKGAIVYVKNSYNYLVFSDVDTYDMFSLNEKILNANVSSSGSYSIVTQESGYESCVNAYTKDNKSIFKWHTNDTITDSAISSNAKYVVTSSLVLTDDNINSKLTFLNTSSSKIVKEISLDDNLVSELYFVNNDYIIAFGSEYTSCYTINGIEKWKINYNDKVFSTYDISDEGILAFVFNRYNSDLSESSVMLYDLDDGDLLGEYNSNENIKSVSVNNDYCLLSTDDKSILLDDDCDVEKIKEYDFDFDSIKLYENYHFGFVIDDNIARIVSVKR